MHISIGFTKHKLVKEAPVAEPEITSTPEPEVSSEPEPEGTSEPTAEVTSKNAKLSQGTNFICD